MAESIAFSKTADRSVIYKEIVPQIEALVEGETDVIANLANVAAVLKEAFGFFWIGFYIAKQDRFRQGSLRTCVLDGIDDRRR